MTSEAGIVIEFLNALGLQVIRYTNEEILRNTQGVYDDLSQSIAEHQGAPS